MFITINGYAYYQMRLSPRLLGGMLNALIKFWPEFKRSEQRWRDEAHVRYVAVIQRWRSRPASALAAAELLEAARQLMAETVNTYNVLQSGVLGLAGGVEVLFTAVYDRLIKRPDDPPAVTFLLGFDSLPILAEKSLYDLAQQARACPALAEHIARAPAAELARQLAGETAGDQTPPGLEAEAWRTWQHGFAAHLERYGHTIYDLDFAKPVPADNPAPLLEACKMYLDGRGPNPHERQQTLARRREQAAQAMLGRLKGLRLKLFRTTLGWAQRFAPMREDSLADLGLGYPLVRQLLGELGQRLTQAGVLARPNDVYWLYEDEVVQAAADRLKGAGASPGRVTGQARVLRGPEDFDQMRPGEILVAITTTPAWTPLFAMASAIVTDGGGPLSHGSIVAREYGIPAVMGTGVATRRIRSRQVITVDGGDGAVLLSGGGDGGLPRAAA
jgi:pyruvate,water dikinase